MLSDPSSLGVVLALLGTVGGSSWFWYDKKMRDKRIGEIADTLKQVKEKQIEQENKFITEPRTREILREEVSSLKKDISEVKIHVSNINTNLSGLVADIRVLTAVQDLLKDK